MSPRRCSIIGCKSVMGRALDRGVTFHAFPIDETMRNLWEQNCRPENVKSTSKVTFICSRHFRRIDFQQTKSNKYLLKSDAVPTIFPWTTLDTNKLEIPSIIGTAPTTSESASAESPKKPTDHLINQALVDEIAKSAAKLAMKRSASAEDATASEPHKKIGRKSLDSAKKNVANAILPKHNYDPVSLYLPGSRIEVQDFNESWHPAKVVEVDHDEHEVLIHFEKSGKIKTPNIIDEWIPMNSIRLRPLQIVKKPVTAYAEGEKCLARWSDSRKFPGTVQKVLENNTYEVLFDDGFSKIVKGNHMSRIKSSGGDGAPKSVRTPSATPTRKTNPPLPIPKFDLSKMNLLPVPKDGEWCCYWINDTPIGAEGYLEGPDGFKRPTVLVEDWRLPSGWQKHLYQRSSVSGKWDVVLVGPTKKRFRSKNDVKAFLDERGEFFNPDIYDFSIHKRRAKDLNLFIFTDDYKELQKQKLEAAAAKANATKTPDTSALDLKLDTSDEVFTGFSPAEQTVTSLSSSFLSSPATPLCRPEPTASPLQDGEVYVGALKVQLIDNLFRCPDKTCNKNFRKENHLQIHVKHYHDDLAKLLGVCPNMTDLAYQRTTGQAPEETKNQIPNSQFFEKVYQSDISSKHNRKSMSSPTASILKSIDLKSDEFMSADAAAENGVSFMAGFATDDDIVKHLPDLKKSFKDESSFEQTFKLQECIGHPIKLASSAAATSTPLKSADSMDIESVLETHSVGRVVNESADNQSLPPPPPPVVQANPSTAGRRPPPANRAGRRKGSTNKNRGKIKIKLRKTKNINRSLDAAKATTIKENIMNIEDTRHSFSCVSDIQTPKNHRLKFLQQSSIDSNLDATSSLTSLQNLEPSPRYISENGEMIKIVRMRQEEIINCLCGYGEEDGLMIQCELCLCWQHGTCNGIEKESEVPDKYVCYICKNPTRGRTSMKYIHDQDWLFEGKLPMANLLSNRIKNTERFERLKQSHTLVGNLMDLKRFMHSLKVKINIADNKDHPKMYLWAKKWEKSSPTATEVAGIEPLAQQASSGAVKRELKMFDDMPNDIELHQINQLLEVKSETESPDQTKLKEEDQTTPKNKCPPDSGSITEETKHTEDLDDKSELKSDLTAANILEGLLTSATTEPTTPQPPATPQHHQQLQQYTPKEELKHQIVMNIPQPEAAIDSSECQLRLLEHIQKQQALAMARLQTIEAQIIGLEAMDEKIDSQESADSFTHTIKVIYQLLNDLGKMKKLAEINLEANRALA